MKNNEIKNINFLGRKKNKNNQISSDEIKTDEEEKTKENNQKILSCKRPEFFTTIIKEKNGIILEEKKWEKIEDENGMNQKICQRCNSVDNVLSFRSYKSILDYPFKKNNLALKNFFLNEDLNFDSPKIICLKCLLAITKNRTEFAKFFGASKNKINNVNDNPFNNLLGNPNLKYFNNKDIKKIDKNQNELNDKFNDNFGKLNTQNSNNSSSLNNAPYNNKNNILNNPNINLDILNILKYLPVPSFNYNIPINQNISNLNFPNYYNLNTYLANPLIKENNNQSKLLQNKKLNYSDILHHSLLNKSPGIFNLNNTDILTLSKLPLFNKNFSIKKKKKNDCGLNTIMNNINMKNNKEKLSKDNSESLKQNNIPENYTIIKNKEFDEIFQESSQLFQKLLDVKIGRDLNLYTKKIFVKDSQISSLSN